MNFFKRIGTWQGILQPNQIKGEMPLNSTLYKRTFDMAWPSAIENLFIALIGAIDMIMVGYLGKAAISAVGIVNQPRFLCLAPIFALNTAVIVFVARRKGEGNQIEANDYMKIAVFFSLLISLIFCSISFYFSEEILLFAGAQKDYINLANDYYRIILISLVPYSVGLTMTSAQRGAGYTKISLVTNLTANIINVIFNALLIHGLYGFPSLGVKGAAIATAIGNVSSFVIALISISIKGRYLRFNFSFINNLYSKIKNLFNVATNTFIEQLFIRFGFFMYAKVVANLGTAEFAAHQVCMNVMTISFGIGDGLQVANTSLVGQSLGAKRPDLAIVQSRLTQLIGMCCAFVVFLIVSILHEPILNVFTQEVDVINLATLPMYVLSFTVMFQIPQVIIIGCLRGAGDVKFVAWMMLLCVGIIRPLLSYLFVYPLGFGLIGAWIGLFMDQFMRFTISFMRFKQGKWLDIKV